MRRLLVFILQKCLKFSIVSLLLDLALFSFDLSRQLQYLFFDSIELLRIFEQYFLFELDQLLRLSLQLLDLPILLEDSVIDVSHGLADVLQSFELRNTQK